MTTIRIPILTCKVCGCQFAKSRKIVLRGAVIIRFETRSKFCSNACRQKHYRNQRIIKRREYVTKDVAYVTIA